MSALRVAAGWVNRPLTSQRSTVRRHQFKVYSFIAKHKFKRLLINPSMDLYCRKLSFFKSLKLVWVIKIQRGY